MTRELLDLRASLRSPARSQGPAHERGALLLEHVAAFIAGLAATAIVAPEPGVGDRAVDVVTESLRFAVALHRNDVPGLDRRDTPLEHILLRHRLVVDERGTITWYDDEELEAEAAHQTASRKGGHT